MSIVHKRHLSKTESFNFKFITLYSGSVCDSVLTKKNKIVMGPSKIKKDPHFVGTGGPRTPIFQNQWELCIVYFVCLFSSVSYSGKADKRKGK